MTGKFELFKTSTMYDGTTQNPQWMDEAELGVGPPGSGVHKSARPTLKA